MNLSPVSVSPVSVIRNQLFQRGIHSKTALFHSKDIPFVRKGNIIPVLFKSMSPKADYLISKSYRQIELPNDCFVNKREELIRKYAKLFTFRRPDMNKYLEDVSTNWDPIKQFPSTPRWPVPLLPLSHEALEEIDDLPNLMNTLKQSDEWSAKRQDPHQSSQTSWGVLTMPIKLPEDEEVFLPSNLLRSRAICEIVKHAAAAIKGIESSGKKDRPFHFKYYWMYCTVHIQLGLKPNEAMRDQMIHVDGMMGANKNTGEAPLWPKQHLIFTNILPTEYYTSEWSPPILPDNRPDYSKNWFSRMDKHCKVIEQEKPKQIEVKRMYLISPYLMHESPINKTSKAVNRLFIRIGFNNTHYNGPIYTVNPRLGQFRGLEDRAILNRPTV